MYFSMTAVDFVIETQGLNQDFEVLRELKPEETLSLQKLLGGGFKMPPEEAPLPPNLREFDIR